jgi:adenylate cyclase
MSGSLQGILHRLPGFGAADGGLTGRFRLPVVAGLLLVAAMAVIQGLGLKPVERLSMQLFDTYHRAQPRPYEDAPVRVVDIDEESIRRLGQWPWPRTEIARLTDRLSEAGAAAIAFDIVFSEPDRTSPARVASQLERGGVDAQALAGLRLLPDNDGVLGDSIAKGPVVLGYFLLNDRPGPALVPKAGLAIAGSPPTAGVARFARSFESLPQLDAAANGKGFVSLAAAGDGIVRQLPLLAWQGDQLVPSLSLEALRVAQGAGSIVVRTSDASGEVAGQGGRVVAVKVGDFEVPTTASGNLWLHLSEPAPQRIIPAWKVLSDELVPANLAQDVEGQIVLVGAGAAGLRDLVSTPLRERELGVVVHAQAIEQMILGRHLLRPDWAPGLERVLVLVLGIGLALLLPRFGAARGAVLVFVAIGAMVAGSWLAFSRWQYLLDPTWPVLTAGLVYVLQTAMIFYREERRRAYIHSAFDRYLSPEMVKRIAADPDSLELGGEEREMTVLFCDVRNFSGISERLTPKQLISFLIDLLTPLCDVLLARRATIDKFIGDAIVAFWNAPLDDPDQHRNAGRAALEMSARLKELNAAQSCKAGSDWPGEVRLGIGLNFGTCCVGNMGSAQRLSYSLIGDTVNLASRIEGLTKQYGVEIAMGEALSEKLPDFAQLEIDLVQVVGRAAPEPIHVLLGEEKLAQDADFIAFRARHEAMLAAYRAADWRAAAEAAEAAREEAERFGLARLYEVYRARIARLSLDPPGVDWNGVYVAREK